MKPSKPQPPDTPIDKTSLPHVTPASTGTASLSPAPRKDRRDKIVKIALVSFIALCTIAAAGLATVIVLNQATTKQENKPKDTKQDVVKSSTPTAAKAIEHVKEYFKADQTAKNAITLPVRAPGKEFYTVIPDIAPLYSVAGNVAGPDVSRQLESIVHSLEGDSFTKREQSPDSESSDYLAEFTSKKTVCEVSTTRALAKAGEQSQNTDAWLEARCLDVATYSEYANAQEPLVVLYPPLTATSVLYGFVGKPVTKPGTDPSYSTSELQVSIVNDDKMAASGKYALYYRSPDGLWHYFADRDNDVPLECALYANDQLKATYSGLACRDLKKGNLSTVPAPKKKK